MLTDKTLLITGGTGTLGHALVRELLPREDCPARIVILSRDEYKQAQMRAEFEDDDRLRFFLGDVRDKDRLLMAFRGVDYVIHAAAMKRIEACEYDSFEAVRTNVFGAENVIEAALERDVRRVVAVSTDKAVEPANLYGTTKACAERLFIGANAYAGDRRTRFSVIRYGNVFGSRGSVVELWRRQAAADGQVTLTAEGMTRFWLTPADAAAAVLGALFSGEGGEIFVPKLRSCFVADLARVVAPAAWVRVTGIRPGEKLHECLISEEEARRTTDRGSRYVIEPQFPWHVVGYGPKATADRPEIRPPGWRYTSDSPENLMTAEEVRRMVS